MAVATADKNEKQQRTNPNKKANPRLVSLYIIGKIDPERAPLHLINVTLELKEKPSSYPLNHFDIIADYTTVKLSTPAPKNNLPPSIIEYILVYPPIV
jgi:hypothetical protein